MDKHNTEAARLHALREECRKARLAKRAVVVNVEDAIFTRLVAAEELLTVAMGLFSELAENQQNWLFNFKDDIIDARWALNNTINDRLFAE